MKCIRELHLLLKSFNRFFNKIDSFILKCLLKVGNLIFLGRDQQLYQYGKKSKYFYIVVCGKILIKDTFHRNYVITG